MEMSAQTVELLTDSITQRIITQRTIDGLKAQVTSLQSTIKMLKDVMEENDIHCSDCSGDLNRENYEYGICESCQWHLKN